MLLAPGPPLVTKPVSRPLIWNDPLAIGWVCRRVAVSTRPSRVAVSLVTTVIGEELVNSLVLMCEPVTTSSLTAALGAAA